MEKYAPKQITIEIKCLMDEQKLYDEFAQLPKHSIVSLQSILSKVRKDKYESRATRFYGSLNRFMTKEQLELFFDSMHRRDTKRLFLIQFFFALRIGELYHLEVFPDRGLLKIYNQKCKRYDYLPLHGRTIELFQEPLTLPYPGNLNKSFKIALKKAKLDFIYREARTTKNKLTNLTPHSLRHSGITMFMNYLDNPIKCMKFSRHQNDKSFGCLPIYSGYPLDQMKSDLEEAFKDCYHLIDCALYKKREIEQMHKN